MQRWPLLLALALLPAATPSFAAQPPDQKALEEKLAAVVPSDRQYDWQLKHDVYAFVHFGPNTFSGREWGTGTEDPAIFNPTALDATQWAKALKSAGMTMAVLTVKHHDGFCLWPSRYTTQSVKNSPWKNGHGDVLREFVDAIRAQGMDVGIYLSPADLFQIENAAGYYGDGSTAVDSVIPTDPASFKSDPTKARAIAAGAPAAQVTLPCKVDDYNRYFLNQLFELLTEYGPVEEVWFDGATPKSKGGQKYAYAAWYALIRKLQPHAVIYGKGPDVRWVGNENGTARDTEWSVVGLSKPEAEFDWPDMTGRTLGDRTTLARAADLHWYPAEADVSILPGWFYHDDKNMKSVDKLMSLYESSVGRNAALILNVPPDTRGLFSDAEVATLNAFGQARQNLYGTNLAAGATITATNSLSDHPAASALDGNYDTYWEAVPKSIPVPPPATSFAAAPDTPVVLDITLPRPVTFRRVVLQEQIRRGQRVEAFSIDALQADSQWHRLGGATTIGYKRIVAVPETTATQLRVRFEGYRVAPTLAELGLFN